MRGPHVSAGYDLRENPFGCAGHPPSFDCRGRVETENSSSSFRVRFS